MIRKVKRNNIHFTTRSYIHYAKEALEDGPEHNCIRKNSRVGTAPYILRAKTSATPHDQRSSCMRARGAVAAYQPVKQGFLEHALESSVSDLTSKMGPEASVEGKRGRRRGNGPTTIRTGVGICIRNFCGKLTVRHHSNRPQAIAGTAYTKSFCCTYNSVRQMQECCEKLLLDLDDLILLAPFLF